MQCVQIPAHLHRYLFVCYSRQLISTESQRYHRNHAIPRITIPLFYKEGNLIVLSSINVHKRSWKKPTYLFVVMLQEAF